MNKQKGTFPLDNAFSEKELILDIFARVKSQFYTFTYLADSIHFPMWNRFFLLVKKEMVLLKKSCADSEGSGINS